MPCCCGPDDCCTRRGSTDLWSRDWRGEQAGGKRSAQMIKRRRTGLEDKNATKLCRSIKPPCKRKVAGCYKMCGDCTGMCRGIPYGIVLRGYDLTESGDTGARAWVRRAP